MHYKRRQVQQEEEKSASLAMITKANEATVGSICRESRPKGHQRSTETGNQEEFAEGIRPYWEKAAELELRLGGSYGGTGFVQALADSWRELNLYGRAMNAIEVVSTAAKSSLWRDDKTL